MLRRRDQLLSVMAKEPLGGADHRQHLMGADRLPGMRERLGAGVRFRTIFDHDSLEHEPHRAWVASLDDHPGFEVRVDRVDTLYLLVDGYVVFLNLTVPGSESPGSHAESLLMRHAGLAQTLQHAFERTWRHGVPLSRPSRRTAHPPWWAQRPARATPPHPGGAGRAPATAAQPNPAEPARPVGRRGNSLGPPGPQYPAVRPNWWLPRAWSGGDLLRFLGSFGESSPNPPNISARIACPGGADSPSVVEVVPVP